MADAVPAVPIWPKSAKNDGCSGPGNEAVQERYFLGKLPAQGGRWRYRSAGLKSPPGTVVLFQFRARIIASAAFVRDEKFDRPVRGCDGVLHFDPASFRTFDPLDVDAMRAVWPRFRGFG